MLMVRAVDGQGQLEAEEGMLADMCLRCGVVQIMSTRALDPRTAVMLTDQTCDDVTIIPATGPRNNNVVRWLTHGVFVDWACTLVFDACWCPRCCNWEMNDRECCFGGDGCWCDQGVR